MSDPVQIVLGLVRSHDVARCASLAEGLRALMNRRNQNIFWAALIDSAHQAHSQGRPGDPLALLKLFVANKLEVNVALENGDLPLNILMSRSPALATLAVKEIGFNVNVSDRSGRTPALHGLDLAKSKSLGAYATLAALARASGFDLDAKDQGAALCFKGLAWAPLAAAQGDPEAAVAGARALIDALAVKGYDFNAARETPDTKFGATINTPLAYCIKKAAHWLEWSGQGAKAARVGGVVWAIAGDLVQRGADPCLQMESGQHVQLMDLCRKSNFPEGMMQSLEAGLLAQAVNLTAPPPRAVARRL